MTKYNKEQEIAITTIDGPVLIIAGPGSGKTFTIVERLVHMVANLKIDPSQILLSTFTNKAANELLDRLSMKFKEKNISKDVNDMFLGNFHSICRKILNEYIDYLDLNENYRQIDDVEKRYIIKNHLKYFRQIPGYASIINSYEVRNIEKILSLVFEEGILERKSSDKRFQTIFDIVSLYEKIMVKYNLMDFSMVLFLTYKLLALNPQVKKELQEKIKYIMIDEYQDTNKVQEKILFSILNEEENICVVGDDDQGLYRFRGASVKNILNFGTMLKNPVKKVVLNTNYRSNQHIVNFYSSFMDSLGNDLKDIDKYRFKKDLQAHRSFDGQTVFKMTSPSIEDFKSDLVNLIKSLKDQDRIHEYNQVAILVSSVNDYRILDLVRKLKENNIGVYIPKTTTLMSRTEIHRMIGAFYKIFIPLINKYKLILPMDSQKYLATCLQKLTRSRAYNSDLDSFLDKMGQYLVQDKVNLELLDLAYRLFRYDPFKSYLDDMENEREKKNLSRFLELLKTFSYLEGIHYIFDGNKERFIHRFFGSFLDFIKDEKYSEFEEDTKIPDKNQISLLTIHASKGMEYPVVIMASLWDREFKNYSNLFLELLDEFSKTMGKENFEPSAYIEKIDFYKKYFTGFSRAEDCLILAGVQGEKKGNDISNSLAPYVEKLSQINIGDIKALPQSAYEDNPIKNIYSYTQDLALYKTCPRAFYLFRKMNFTPTLNQGMLYGNIIHQTIEYLNKHAIKGQNVSEDEINRQIKDQIILARRAGFIVINPEQTFNQLQKEIYTYWEQIDKFDQIIGSEMEITLANKDFILRGNVDMVFEQKDGYNIVDFKTGDPGKMPKSLLKKYQNQLNLYAFLLEKTKGEKVQNTHLYFSNTGQTITSSAQEASYIDQITNQIKTIEADTNFEKTKDTKNCQTCPFKYYCRRN